MTSDQSAPPCVPVHAVAGLPGCGKTTLLVSMAKAERRRKRNIAAIVQAVGTFNVDAAILRGNGIPVVELNRVTGRTDAADWKTVFHDVAALRPDDVLLETVHQPSFENEQKRLIDFAEASLGGEAQVIEFIVAVDALGGVDGCAKSHYLLEGCDRAVITKVDRAGADQVTAIRDWMTAHAPQAQVFTARNGRVEAGPDWWRTPLSGEAEAARMDEVSATPRSHGVHGPPFLSAMTLAAGRTLNRETFEAFLDGLPPAVSQVKGFVRFIDEVGLWMVYRWNGENFIRPVTLDPLPAEHLVFVGQAFPDSDPLDRDALAAGVAACEVGRRRLVVL